jgi:hypothetical protein
MAFVSTPEYKATTNFEQLVPLQQVNLTVAVELGSDKPTKCGHPSLCLGTRVREV